jgi:hypothetical protein
MSNFGTRIFTEKYIRSTLTVPNYDAYLDRIVYQGEDPFKLPADDDWDPKTGTCATHALFTIDSLGGKVTENLKQYKGFKIVRDDTIDTIVEKLDLGSIIELVHTYRDKSLVETLPRNNVYDSHDFVLVKGGNKYFLSQGFQFVYKHSLKAYTKEQIKKMLHELLEYICDPDNTKQWKDLDFSYYMKYFNAILTVGKMSQLRPIPSKKVNGLVLEYLEIKHT